VSGTVISAVKGTKDILPGEIAAWQKVESAAKALFELHGYRELRAPVFEMTELFEKGTGATSDIVTKEMYTFTDKGGRSVTLRPEYTPSVVRAAIEHALHLKPEPMRFYFIGPMFRYDKPQKGRYRQFHQIDVEVFGEKDAAVDAELISIAHELLEKLGVRETETLINSVGCRACRPAYSAAMREAAGARLESLCPDCRRKAELNPLRIFDCKVESCRAEAAGFPRITNHICGECRVHFEELQACLDTLGLKYSIEPRLVRGLDYYTRTTFEITAAGLGAQNSLLGGGRYDDMIKDFGGPDLAATGFAMGMERLLAVVPPPLEERRIMYIAPIGREAMRASLDIARFFRRNDVECLLEFKDKGLKSHLGRAGRLNAAWTLIIGDDELASGRLKLKDMATGEQREGRREELLEILFRQS
jgi:histidyl-tRNA synthetase